jgi:hypothetical protein
VNEDQATPLDDEYTGLLASLDDALAEGGPLPEPDAAPELRARLRRRLACLQLLDGLRPGREPPGAGAGAGDSAGAGEADTHPTVDGRAGPGTAPARGTPSYMAPEQAAGRGRGRPGRRRLRAGGDPLRAADRPAAVPGGDGAGDPAGAGAQRGAGAAAGSSRGCRATWRRSA